MTPRAPAPATSPASPGHQPGARMASPEQSTVGSDLRRNVLSLWLSPQ